MNLADQIAGLIREPARRTSEAPACQRQRPDALALFLACLRAVHAGEVLPIHVAVWLTTGMQALLAGEETSLDRALGIQPGRGESNIADQHKRMRRDDRLRDAWRALPGDLSDWQRTLVLLERIQRFESGHPPADAADRFIAEAARTGARLPTTAQGLDRAIGR